MKKLIPLEKRSKKEQKAWYARQRGDWNGVNPVTKVVPSKKLYNRKKQRREPLPDAVFFIASPVCAPIHVQRGTVAGARASNSVKSVRVGKPCGT